MRYELEVDAKRRIVALDQRERDALAEAMPDATVDDIAGKLTDASGMYGFTAASAVKVLREEWQNTAVPARYGVLRVIDLLVTLFHLDEPDVDTNAKLHLVALKEQEHEALIELVRSQSGALLPREVADSVIEKLEHAPVVESAEIAPAVDALEKRAVALTPANPHNSPLMVQFYQDMAGSIAWLFYPSFGTNSRRRAELEAAFSRHQAEGEAAYSRRQAEAADR